MKLRRYCRLISSRSAAQCGCVSDVVGNLLSADEQERKLERVVETARQVWGR